MLDAMPDAALRFAAADAAAAAMIFDFFCISPPLSFRADCRATRYFDDTLPRFFAAASMML